MFLLLILCSTTLVSGDELRAHPKAGNGCLFLRIIFLENPCDFLLFCFAHPPIPTTIGGSTKTCDTNYRLSTPGAAHRVLADLSSEQAGQRPADTARMSMGNLSDSCLENF